ncbi:MAG TPA: hypothetical protein PLG17_02385 [Thermodesulfobacteriota bacterium]|nr:hypothetical protein [Deltaproteobacteria bacterium]HNR13552.1 hypothetical protein [Thermodesulfobacteriota bacterium]HNU73085.1 hypothetical protein [Thermodesulfobacteriota bacterium]HOC38786.1 hypothetical protein [Thermodesulfobacteriota bacterium]HQO77341.1 hypothetical protein [Thermodesulfobacteriota bacterium]
MGKSALRHYLVANGMVDEQTMFEALNIQRKMTPSIGTIALEERVLSVSEVLEILDLQDDCSKLFGELAIDLGYLSEREIERLLEIQESRRPPIHQILLEMNRVDPDRLDSVVQKFPLS